MANTSATAKAAVNKDDLKKYEVMVILNSDNGEDAAKKALTQIKSWILDRQGEIFFEDIWGIKDLAYSIKKHDRGYYVVLNFLMLPESINTFERELRLEPMVLRHLIVSLPFKYEPKTFAQLAEKAKEDNEKQAKEDEAKPKSGKKSAQRNGLPKKVAPVAPKVEKEEAAKPAKKKETSMAEVDTKLKSIIDNPDLNF